MAKKKSRALTAARKPAKKLGAARAAAPKKSTKPAGHDMDEAAMMAAWQKAMTPGKGHARLERIVGTFTTRTTFWMAPGAPPDVSEAVSEHRWVLGGRYVEQNYRGSAMGMPFEGLGYTGFDNQLGKYVGCWMDNMGTGMMTSQSTGIPTDAKIESICHAVCPEGPTTMRSILRIADRDHHTYEMFAKGPDGREFRNMLIEYRRK